MAYEVPPMFTNCTFSDTIMPDGTLLTATEQPIILGRGNIVFPIDWSEQRRRDFRVENNMHGPEWPRDDAHF